ncbi:MAG TPA: tetratricopeptide repeat protein [bacterium]
MSRLQPLLLPAAVATALAAGVTGIYRHVGEFSFVFDDGGFILDNPRVQDGLTLESVRWAMTATHTANWQPLTWLSHLADISLFGVRPGPAHVVNVLIHLLNCLLILTLLRRLTGALWPSSFVAMLFAVHPLHIESVAWVSERKDVLSALCWLLATWAYVRYVARGGIARYLVVCLLFALGVTAKAMVVTLPVTLLLLDWWPLGRLAPGTGRSPRWRAVLLEKVPLLAISAAASLVAIAAQRRGGALASPELYRPAWRVANAAISYAVYLGKTLWPAGLAVYYPFPLETRFVVSTAGAALLVLSLTGVAAGCARRNPAVLTGWVWYLVGLLPVLGLIQVGGQARADRYLYLPMIGLGIAAGWGAQPLAGRLRHARTALAAPALATLALFALIATHQVEYWRTNEALFRHALAVTKDNWIAHSFLGWKARRDGDVQAAIGHYREAVRINPSSSDMRFNLGLALIDAGNAVEAAGEVRAALLFDPALAEARYWLAVSLLQAQQFPEALENFRAAARLFPERAVVWNGLGEAALRLGLFAEAESAFREAVRLQPGATLFQRNLRHLLARRRQGAGAD